MKHLKSSYRDLHQLFERSITVREIAEPLTSFHENDSAEEVRRFMEGRDFDVVGVQRAGTITEYVEREDLESGTVGESARPFEEGQMVHESEPLLTALEAMKTGRWVFVRFLGNPSGIVTRGDLQKAPMRMWLFGLLSLLEMQLLRRIRDVHPDDSWREFLKPERIESAEKVLNIRKARNEAIDLDECLQWGDKKVIFAKSDRLFELVKPWFSKQKWLKFMERAEALRNNLAHSNDLGSDNWPRIAETVENVETLLRNLESGGPEIQMVDNRGGRP